RCHPVGAAAECDPRRQLLGDDTMPTIVDKTAYDEAAANQPTELLPVSPFTAIQYNFGMLLGVDDLETAQAYPRGKMRLDNAWLHREGVVRGLNVSFNA